MNTTLFENPVFTVFYQIVSAKKNIYKQKHRWGATKVTKSSCSKPTLLLHFNFNDYKSKGWKIGLMKL